jgi:heme A synthase
VIVWGAVVRATGSGAGCGSHWPTCNGEVLPSIAELETAVEFIHRVTSAFSGVLVIALVVWAFRRPSVRFTRIMAVLSLVFILIEGGIGAALVRLELVEDNASTLRAVMIALHLVNTLFLMAWLALTAWSGAKTASPGVSTWLVRAPLSPRLLTLLGIAVVGTMILSAAGAVTALGDTLFLSGALEQVTDDPRNHFLIQLRVIHPVLAVVVSVYLFLVGGMFIQAAEKDSVRRLVYLLYAAIVMQTIIGVANITFLAPVVLQMLHLLMADVLWITLVILSAELLFTGETVEVRDLQPAPAAA